MIQIDRLTKRYGDPATGTLVLDRLSLQVASREIAAVVGPSGAGKSTLAQCTTLLERPTSGSVIVNGDELTGLTERELRLARRRIGTIFQSDGLLSRRTVAQNVALPLEYLGVTKAGIRSRVSDLLDRVGLLDKSARYPHELSGGQRQRVGIARALALRPSVLLSDEATSGLDPEATAAIIALLTELRDEFELSILFITHEMEAVLAVADTVARLDRGRIVESGALVDLLRDPQSELGATLRPHRSAQEAAAGQAAWRVQYGEDDVPADWLGVLAAELGSTVALLGASIEIVHGRTVGHATIGVSTTDAPLMLAALRRLGLDGSPVTTPNSSAIPSRLPTSASSLPASSLTLEIAP